MNKMSECYIEGIDRMQLLRNAWYAACLSKGVGTNKWNTARAIADLQLNGYAERIIGVSLKLHLFKGATVDAKNYNQMHGEGRFEQVVQFIRCHAKAPSRGARSHPG